MGTLLLKLAGPLQSWGAESRFTERKTQHEPTKSGVIGLLASALGRQRSDGLNDLQQIIYGVRIDQPGHYECDFQTAHRMVRNKESEIYELSGKDRDTMPMSNRYYLSDAVFVVGLETDDCVLREYAEALLHPAYPLFLGRRSCPPSDKVLIGFQEGASLMEALGSVPMLAQKKYRMRQKRVVELEVMRDALSSEAGFDMRDMPVSFSQVRRDYSWRTVVRDTVVVENPDGKEAIIHDPWSALKEV